VSEELLNAFRDFVDAVSETAITLESEREVNRTVDQRLRNLITARDAMAEALNNEAERGK
jgi:cell shape-determining protein MreC